MLTLNLYEKLTFIILLKLLKQWKQWINAFQASLWYDSMQAVAKKKSRRVSYRWIWSHSTLSFRFLILSAITELPAHFLAQYRLKQGGTR